MSAPDLVTAHGWVELAVAFVLGVTATARFTRLVIYDSWPPMRWLRERYRHAVNYGDWEGLVTCPFCLAPWPALADIAWAWASDLHWSWWVANLWFAAAYLASMIVVRDEPPEE